MNILILGCGQLGQALTLQLHHAGHQVIAVSRSAKQLAEGITHIEQDILQLDLSAVEQKFDWVYVILSPFERSLYGYQQAYVNTILPITQALRHHPVQKLIYVSSTRVYGENTGHVVDDETAPYNDDPYAQILRSAELLYSAYWQEKLTIVRPSGLYNGESQRLIEMAKNLHEIHELHWINLIHRNDVVNILALLTTLPIEHLQDSYILTAPSAILQYELLNRIRQQRDLKEIIVEKSLPNTGKRLQATRLSTLLQPLNYQWQCTF